MSLAKTITNYDNPKSIGSKLRAKRIKPLVSMIQDIYNKNGSVKILDVGGTKQYWGIIPREIIKKNNVHITLLNLPSQNKPQDDEIFTYCQGDACNIENFGNNSFDIVHSNSVVEHVGDWRRMVMYSNEIKRLAKNYYVQTPNFWFPVEPHCMTLMFHWLPKPIRVSLVMKFSLGHWQRQSTVRKAVSVVEGARLLDKKMFRALFQEAEIKTERFFLIPKSFIAINKSNG